MVFWIGTTLLDSLFSYPERNNLSSLSFPIQIAHVYSPASCIEAQIQPAGHSFRVVPRSGLFLSGVTPLSGVLHQLGGGVMLPNWCNLARYSAPAQEISVDWWCTMIRRDSPEVAGAHTLDSSEAPPSHRTR